MLLNTFDRTDLDREEDEQDKKARKEDSQITSPLIEETLFKKRYVLITGEINDKVARITTERLLALAAESSKPITVFISSPGGHVESGDMIHDVIDFITPEVRTVGSGWVASAGALIFVAVPRERRFCLPNTRFLLHQPSGAVGGRGREVLIQAEQIMRMKARFDNIFAEATGQTPEQIAQDTMEDFWLTASQALEYGLLGAVIRSQKELDNL